jgi:hypothetical protein
MGSFFTQDKSGYYWFLLGYLQDENIYVRDSRLLPYTPGKSQTYVDFYPALYNPVLPQSVQFKVNDQTVAWAKISLASGAAYTDIPVPLGAFKLETWHGSVLLKTEQFISKNYAMFLGVQAQSYDERLADLDLVKADQDFIQMRSDSLYPILGAMFDFPPPPGWDVQQYRDAILGGCGPGLRQAFFDGTTKAGVSEAIEAVTCELPTIYQGQRGNRWTVFDNANSDPANPAARGFYITDNADISHVFTPPHYRAVMASQIWWARSSLIVVNGSVRTPPTEDMLKNTDSYIEAPVPEMYDLQSRTLTFTIEQPGVRFTTQTFFTSFILPTFTAADVAAGILAANPSLTSAVYATAVGMVRIGVPPQAGKVFRITIIGGSALEQLGWRIGQSVDITPDSLANPWLTTPVTITDGVTTWVDGVDFTSIPETGEIVWKPSTALNTGVPLAGVTLQANYSYQMRREILQLAERAKEVNDIIQFEWN